MSEDRAPNLRLLKAVVTVLGVAILVILGIIVVTVVNRLGGAIEEEPPAAAPAASPLGTFDPTRIPIPPGGRVVDLTPAGARLIVRLDLGDGASRLLFLDIADGRLLGHVDLVAP